MMIRFLPAAFLSKKFTGIQKLLAILVLWALSANLSAQTLATVGTATSTTSTSGLSSTTTTGDRNERHTTIYSIAELTAAGINSGSTLLSIAWEKTGAASYAGNNLTIRVWLKHNNSTTFPANPLFATETSTATLVHESTNGTIPAETGWISFPFNNNTFTWNGTENLQVITELIRPTSWTTTGFLWRTIASLTNAAANASGTTATPAATLTRTATRPQVRFEVAANGNDAALVSMPNPVSTVPGSQDIDVVLRNTGTTTLSTANIAYTINGGAPVNFPWAGSLAPGASATVTIGNLNFSLGTYIIEATVSAPNGGADQDPSNNTVSKTILVCAPLSGAYTIDNTQPTAGTNFHSFTDFSSYLTNCGISGNVIATVSAGSSGVYNEQVIFRDIAGLGAAATITIQGNGQTIVSDTAIIQTGSNPNRHIIKLVDLQYFTINNLRVNMFPGSTGFIGIHILNSGNHITVSNCTVDMGTGTSTLLGAIAATGSESSLLAGGDFNNLLINGNTTLNGGYGAVIYGLANGLTFNNVISNNTITGTNTNAIYVQQNNNIAITANTINFAASNGIQLAGAGNINSLVDRNQISCTNPTSTLTFRGIYVFGSNAASPNKVVNNLIWNMNAPAGTVIGITNRTIGAEFYFNTIKLDDASATSNVTFGFEEDLSNLGSTLRNNIFYITRGSTNYTAAIALASTSVVASAINSDENVFFTGGGATSYVAVRKATSNANPPNNVYATLASWRAASGDDGNSLETDPNFQAGTAIPQSAVIDNQAIPITGITIDITGATRSATTPDPGAYEFQPPAVDAAITNYVLPSIPHCGATLPVQFTLTNAGAVALNTVTINWSVNSVAQTQFNWTGPTLAPGASVTVTLGTIPVAAATVYNFSATASNPNGLPDVNPANDTYLYTGYQNGMQGIYTINAGAPPSVSNYQTFQLIANDLSRHGVCGAVTINVLGGIYTEQVVFNVIPGTSAANTVTLNGNNNILEFFPTLAIDDHILQLNGVEHMIVENLTVNSAHPTQGRGIHITNGASKLVIRNNTVNVSLANTTSISFGIIISGENWLLDGSQTDSVIITGNTVRGGYSAIQLSGIHWTNPLTRITVTNNTVLDWYGFGVYLSYTNGAVVRGNTIRRPTRNNSGSDAVTPAGITIPAGSLNFMLDKNRMYDFHGGMPGTPTISRGVYMSGTGIAPTSGTIQNNLIYGMQNDGAQYGIQQNSVNGPVNIYHNTIVLNSPNGASTSNTNAINMSNFNPQFGTDIRNNIFVVTRGGTGVKRIFDITSASSNFISNYNVAYLNAPGGTQTFGQIGSTNYNTLADWQTTNHDVNSIQSDPAFVSPATGDFRPSNFLADGAIMGTVSVGVPDDILNNARGVNPDPGAFEFAPVVCTSADGGTAASSISSSCGSASATLTATGYSATPGTSYQWQFSNDNFATNINDLAGQVVPSSATTGTITSTTWYRLRVTCIAGPVAYSNIVSVVVSQPVSITTQPLTQDACAGSSVTLSVTATNAASYQWQLGGVGITGATNASYTIANVSTANAGSYTVIVRGTAPCADITSSAAILTVQPVTTITTQPVNRSVCAGNSASFSVTATGTNPTYQWQESINGGPFTNLSNTAPYTGVTTATLTLNPATVALSGRQYRVVVTSQACPSVTSAAATLTVNTAPVPVLTLASYSGITPYVRASFLVTVSPPGTYTYQWYKNAFLVPGITGAGFDATVDDFGTYNVIVTNTVTGCSANTNAVTLRDSVSTMLFIYPNPSSGQFVVRYHSPNSTNVARILNVYDSKGARVYSKTYNLTRTYQAMDVNLANAASGVYLVELKDNAGERIATGKLVIRK